MSTMIAGAVILSKLQTLDTIIDGIVTLANNASRHKEICADFSNFVQKIQGALGRKTSELRKLEEAMLNADAMKQLDELSKQLLQAEKLLADLESYTFIGIWLYKGRTAASIQQLRRQIHESVTTLTLQVLVHRSAESRDEHVESAVQTTQQVLGLVSMLRNVNVNVAATLTLNDRSLSHW